MQKIIYSKYSNERADTFKIRTSIIEKDDGERIVQKTPLTIEAQEHIRNVERYYTLLEKQFEGSKIKINKVYKEDNSIICEYLKGKTLEDRLDMLLEKEDYDGIYQEIKRYIDYITNTKDVVYFKPTKSFKKIFGNVDLPPNLKSSLVSNIDSIFSNIILLDSWWIIDYEWTFEFPIPFNYIIYRAISTYIYTSPKRQILTSLGLYKLCGITNEELTSYETMEKNFQDYIIGNEIPTWQLYEHISGNSYRVQELIETNYQYKDKQEIQIFYDYGEGFNENDSYKVYIERDIESKIKLQIPIKPQVQALRIDPGNVCCITKVNYLMGHHENYYALVCETNGNWIDQYMVLYSTNDPQIICKSLEMNTKEVQIELEIHPLSESVALQLASIVYDRVQKGVENKDIRTMLEKQEVENEHLSSRVKEQELENQGLRDKIQEYEAENVDLRREIEKQKREITSLINIINEKEESIDRLNSAIVESNEQASKEIRACQEILATKEEYINEIHQTKVWKAYRKYKSVIKKDK